MRIVLSNSSYKWGGVHQITEYLAAGLTRRGHEITLLTRPNSLLHERLSGRFNCIPAVFGGDFNPIRIMRLRRLLRRLEPDLLLTLMDKDLRLSGAAARLSGIPVIARRANDQPLDAGWYTRFIYGGIAHYHIANSKATRATMLRSAPWLDANAITVIHNGIDYDRFEKAVPAELETQGVRVGLISRLERRKGVRDLLDAWPLVAAQCQDASLTIVGRGALEREVSERVPTLHRAYYLGFREDVAAVLKALDVVVVPSHWEGFGLIAAEAMAAGKPVIAANASSLPEIVRHEKDGLLVPMQDPERLAEAIVRLVNDANLRATMGATGQRRIRDAFSVDRMVDRYEEFLASIVKRT